MTSTPSPHDHHHTAEDLVPIRLRRFIPLLAVIGISLAVVGYVLGLREPVRAARTLPPGEGHHADQGVPHAVTYSELPTHPLGPNAHWRPSLADLKFDRPGPFDPVTRTDELKQAALADRARNRAYDGAPPTIPHHTWMRENCTSCHGLVTRPGTRTTHPWLTNCTQCHAPSAALDRVEFTGGRK
jgi:hypothetical protein